MCVLCSAWKWGILCVNCACRSTVISPFDIIPCQPVLRLWLSAHSHAWKCLNSRFFFVFHRLDDLRVVLEGGKIIDQLSFVWLKIHLYQKTLLLNSRKGPILKNIYIVSRVNFEPEKGFLLYNTVQKYGIVKWPHLKYIAITDPSCICLLGFVSTQLVVGWNFSFPKKREDRRKQAHIFSGTFEVCLIFCKIGSEEQLSNVKRLSIRSGEICWRCYCYFFSIFYKWQFSYSKVERQKR